MSKRFHDWQKCSKCGRVMAKDISLANCWLIHITGDFKCEHKFEPCTPSYATSNRQPTQEDKQMPELTTTEELSNQAWKLHGEVKELSDYVKKQEVELQKIKDAIRQKQSETAEIIAEIERIDRERADRQRQASNGKKPTEESK